MSLAATTASALPPVVCFGRCELHMPSRELRLDGEVQLVGRRAFDLIVYLITQRPRAVPHRELLRALAIDANAPPRLLARTVVEARRAIGDNARDAQVIVTVFGVGYRFAATVGEPSDDGMGATAPDAAQEEAAALRALIGQARGLMLEGRSVQARELTDEVMKRAAALGSNSEKVEALLIQSSLALNAMNTADGARAATQALRIARAEGFPPLIASAQVACGNVHVLGGDLATGIRHLREALQVLEQPGHYDAQIRCLISLSLALYRQGEFEAALKVCRRIDPLAPRAPNVAYARFSRAYQVVYLVAQGDREAALGQADAARVLYEEAQALNARNLQELQSSESLRLQPEYVYMQAVLLERMDRLDEAWALEEQYRRDVQQSSDDTLSERALRPEVQMQRAWLLARRGQTAQALDTARDALQDAVRRKWVVELEDLYRRASDVAERANHPLLALRWQRERCEVLLASQRDRSVSLAAILAVEMSSDELQSQLDTARAATQRLIEENQQLRQRLADAISTPASDTAPGLGPVQLLAEYFAPAHARARELGEQLHVGVLTLHNASTLARYCPVDATPMLWKHALALLRRFVDIVHPAVQLRHDRAIFRFRAADAALAAAVCSQLKTLLKQEPGRDTAWMETADWQVDCHDAAPCASMYAFIEALL